MKQEKVLELLQLFEQNGIDEVYVDGGWGVDALLEKQTRDHQDLDIAIPHKFENKLREILTQEGYKQIQRKGNWEANFTLADDNGNEIDVHTYTFDENGKNIYGVEYKPEHLTGTGKIGDLEVKTIDPKWTVVFHTWFKPDEEDYHDVKQLCEKFDIPLPEKYKEFEK